MLQRLLLESPEFRNWRWIPVGRFDYKNSFGHLPGSNDAEIECIKRRCAAIIEHHDPDAVIGSSLIWTSTPSSPATLIDDVLTLCSIAKSQYIPVVAQEILLFEGNLRIVHRPTAPQSVLQEVIPQDSLGAFVKNGLAMLQQKDWKEDSGFIPAIQWYTQAQQLFRAGIFSLGFSLYWIVLEILGLAYIQRQSLRIDSKKERVMQFLNSKGFTGDSWSFLSDAVEDWYKVRNYAFHEGHLPDWPRGKLEQRWTQLAEFVSFVLVDLLQPQGENRRDQIGMRLSKY